MKTAAEKPVSARREGGSGGLPAGEDAFVQRPHRTLVFLSIPVLFSLVAEPLTGLADTAFVARLGAEALAALGVGTISLSSVFWIFNFLGIGTQTEVAQAAGRAEIGLAARKCALAVLVGLAAGTLLILLGMRALPWAAAAMGASGNVHEQAVVYMRIRLLGAPAVLTTIAAFGALRGLQDMRTPLLVAVGVNALNIFLDAVLIYGWGPVPAMGIGGAAAASSASQWVGALWSGGIVYRRLGRPRGLRLSELTRLLRIGGDLFVRTGLLTFFLLMATRAATRIGADAGAAHQAIRQVWVLASLVLDAFAVSGQSLVGYFIGSDNLDQARRAARVIVIWSLGAGAFLALAMVLTRPLAATLLVPVEARAFFRTAWLVAAAMQPVTALSFSTDGIHWGTGDFRFLRNVMILATGTGCAGLLLIGGHGTRALAAVWAVTGLWAAVRALFGILRVWPAIGKSPFRRD